MYDAPCVYPLVTKGRCGNKYKCECDSSQYKYTDNECKTTKGSAGEGYENSYGSGSFCTQQRYDTDSHGIVSEIRYSSCQCDRGIYPKFGSMFPKDPSVESDCDFNAERQGPCSTKYANSNKTETYYKFCRCNTGDYPKTDAGCYPLTGDASEGSCFDTIMHYTDCASCAGYDARNLDHVPYSPGSKAVQCQRMTKAICLTKTAITKFVRMIRPATLTLKSESATSLGMSRIPIIPPACRSAVQKPCNSSLPRTEMKNMVVLTARICWMPTVM